MPEPDGEKPSALPPTGSVPELPAAAADGSLKGKSIPPDPLVKPGMVPLGETQSHDTPPTSGLVGFATGGFTPPAIAPQDLSADRLLLVAPRTTYADKSVPSLGGIPLLSKLGQGGMGAVYRGVHPRLNKEVAVKVLPLHLVEQQPGLVQRFFREAQIAARVYSPHLVAVSDVNQDSGLFYLVMEYVNGRSAGSYLLLSQARGGRGLNEGDALDICIAATEGLAAAHAEGIIHRDVKPDNILIPRARTPSQSQAAIPAVEAAHATTAGSEEEMAFKSAKLADLGLARSESLSQSLTGEQNAMGTPGFMAPEQAMNAKKAGKPADVFSMGATLYTLLAGHAPFVGDTPMEAIVAAMQQQHAPLRQARPDIGTATALLVDRCLAKNPKDRFADAPALLEALKACRAAAAERGVTRTGQHMRQLTGGLSGLRRKFESKPGGKAAGAGAQALAPTIGLALQAQQNRQWAQVVEVLEAPLKALGSEPHPEKALAQSLLEQARRELKRERDFREKLQEAENLLASDLHLEAQPLFEEAGNIWPDSPQIKRVTEGLRTVDAALNDRRCLAQLEQARALADAYDYDGAERAYILALAKKPNDSRAQQGLKEVRDARVAHHYQTAMAEARSLLVGEKQDAAHFYIASGKRLLVVDALEKALRARPDDPQAKVLLAKMGPAADCRVDLGEAIKLDLLIVPAGEFQMGSEEGEGPVHRVAISRTFYLAKFPVTVAQFRRFAAQTAYKTDAEREGKGGGVIDRKAGVFPGISWRNPGFEQKDDHPAVVLSWHDAQAFAAWAARQTGKRVRLPTEAEWEYAARGPKSLRYPWGHGWDGQRANHADATLERGRKGCPDWPYSSDNDGYAFTSPVGALPNASWCGALDMAGNVWQWCLDGYSDSYYADSPATDPPGAAGSAFRVVKGGSWGARSVHCRGATRMGSAPAYRDSSFGFRVVVELD